MQQEEVEVTPTPITTGERVSINYEGLLSESGADQVYLHAGVGFNDNWEEVTDIEMHPKGDGSWTAQIRINSADRFNFCFKDSASNWDNNNGSDWSFEVHNGELYTQ
ncbi:carbohydrate-binding protein [Halanaerobaculum tunisiense]